MKYLVYNRDDGSAIGWYDENIHKKIPSPNIQVTEEEYQKYYLLSTEGHELFVRGAKIVVEAIKEPELTWDDIKSARSILLAKTDWSQLDDIPLETKKLYVEYRQQLRDLTTKYENPEDVVWPTEPE